MDNKCDLNLKNSTLYCEKGGVVVFSILINVPFLVTRAIVGVSRLVYFCSVENMGIEVTKKEADEA